MLVFCAVNCCHRQVLILMMVFFSQISRCVVLFITAPYRVYRYVGEQTKQEGTPQFRECASPSRKSPNDDFDTSCGVKFTDCTRLDLEHGKTALIMVRVADVVSSQNENLADFTAELENIHPIHPSIRDTAVFGMDGIDGWINFSSVTKSRRDQRFNAPKAVDLFAEGICDVVVMFQTELVCVFL